MHGCPLLQHTVLQLHTNDITQITHVVVQCLKQLCYCKPHFLCTGTSIFPITSRQLSLFLWLALQKENVYFTTYK
jgi:hypothetical protein